MEVTESYIVLAPEAVLDNNIRFRLLASFEALLGPTTQQRLGVVPHLAEMMIRGVEFVDGNEQAYGVVAKSLLDSSFLPTLLSNLHQTYEAHLTSGPKRKSPAVYGVIETDYLSVLARLAFANPSILISTVVASAGSVAEDQALDWLLKEWFFHFDNIGDVNRKKLHVLALTRLLSVHGTSAPPQNYLLNHLQSYLAVWTDIVTELSEGAEYDSNDPRNGDYLILWNSEPTGSGEEKYHSNESPETTRRRRWSQNDPVHKVNIRNFIADNLRLVVNASGGIDQFRDSWLVNVDHEVVNGFGQLNLL